MRTPLLGTGRAIHHEVTGYSALGRDRTWTRAPGEPVEAMKARVESELRGEGHKVYAVCECYAEEEPA